MTLLHRSFAGALAVAAAVLLGATPAQAATTDYFLKIEGIQGESTSDKHKGEIDIESYSWGVAVPVQAGTRPGAGRALFESLNLSKLIDISSPKLAQAVATGQHFATVVLTGEKSGEQPHTFLEIRLEDALVSSYHTGAAAAGVVPTDQFTLNYARIRYTYTPQAEDGSAGTPVTFCWIVAANRACPVTAP